MKIWQHCLLKNMLFKIPTKPLKYVKQRKTFEKKIKMISRLFNIEK